MALNSGIQTDQILINDDEVNIASLSSNLLAVNYSILVVENVVNFIQPPEYDNFLPQKCLRKLLFAVILSDPKLK